LQTPEIRKRQQPNTDIGNETGTGNSVRESIYVDAVPAARDRFVPVIVYGGTGEDNGKHMADKQSDVETSDDHESYSEAARRKYAIVKQEDRKFHGSGCAAKNDLCCPLDLEIREISYEQRSGLGGHTLVNSLIVEYRSAAPCLPYPE